jgi:hypothetical protein
MEENPRKTGGFGFGPINNNILEIKLKGFMKIESRSWEIGKSKTAF